MQLLKQRITKARSQDGSTAAQANGHRHIPSSSKPRKAGRQATSPEREVLLAPVAPAGLEVVMHDVEVKVHVRALHTSTRSAASTKGTPSRGDAGQQSTHARTNKTQSTCQARVRPQEPCSFIIFCLLPYAIACHVHTNTHAHTCNNTHALSNSCAHTCSYSSFVTVGSAYRWNHALCCLWYRQLWRFSSCQYKTDATRARTGAHVHGQHHHQHTESVPL